MLQFIAPYKKFLLIFLLLSGLIYLGIYSLITPNKTLPIYSPRDVNPELVDSTVQHIGMDHRIEILNSPIKTGK